MKHFWTILFALLALSFAAAAQTRTYGDIEQKAFVIGLDQYYFGSSGSLTFKIAKNAYVARIEGNKVSVSGASMPESVICDAEGDYIIGIHDFTGDKKPELVIACRKAGSLEAEIFQLDGKPASIGRIGAAGEGITEIRVFRQALTIKNHKAGAMYTWTWHKKAFDFKASDGSADPTPAI